MLKSVNEVLYYLKVYGIEGTQLLALFVSVLVIEFKGNDKTKKVEKFVLAFFLVTLFFATIAVCIDVELVLIMVRQFNMIPIYFLIGLAIWTVVKIPSKRKHKIMVFLALIIATFLFAETDFTLKYIKGYEKDEINGRNDLEYYIEIGTETTENLE